ncbi:MAG: stage II sporulation protein M [Oscillospiraceae bacterium]|nr:stage II sporulation protein M [Oscillospiraceae bacterium]
MKGVLQYQISGLKSAWQNGLSGEVLRTAIAFPILVMLSFTLCTVFPALRDSLLSMVLSSMESMGIVNEDGSLSALALFSNNLRATVFIMVYGLVPFIQLPALALGVNTMALGVLASWYIAQGYSIVAFLAAVLPHGLAEFPALILAFGVGLYVCGQVTRRLFRRDESALHIWDCLVLISRMLLLVLIPLLAVAAILEAYVTPLVAALFL